MRAWRIALTLDNSENEYGWDYEPREGRRTAVGWTVIPLHVGSGGEVFKYGACLGGEGT